MHICDKKKGFKTSNEELTKTLEFIPYYGKFSVLLELDKRKEKKKDVCLEALINCVYLEGKGRMDKSELVKRCQSVYVKLLLTIVIFITKVNVDVHSEAWCSTALFKFMLYSVRIKRVNVNIHSFGIKI